MKVDGNTSDGHTSQDVAKRLREYLSPEFRRKAFLEAQSDMWPEVKK